MESLTGVVHRTPLKQSSTLNSLTGAKVYMKMENLQRTGSFKLRGAYNKIASLNDLEAKKGIVAASAGNHAQGVAFAASNRGIRSKIFMPEQTPFSKIEATKSYGAEIVLHGESYQEAFLAARKEQERNGSTFVHAFDDPHVIAGQGTVALEMLQQSSDLEEIIVPVGGGGLISGVALAIKSFYPGVKVTGVQSAGAAATYNRFNGSGEDSLRTVRSIADGIAVKEPGKVTFPLIHQLVDDIVTVTDEEIAYSIVFMLEREKTLVEGAGAAALAALFSKKQRYEQKRVGIIVSGGNTDLDKLAFYKELSKKVNPLKKIS
ncbi:threonine ammonia-lyase [Pseudalkalibacillus caeni]|uniref:L-threonine dehydratase catabolic TdcB n=1 Tax=Exobacillus caeni TaxID=2574798 RepID=A0A5R9FB16_9BACL|nr:threonine ammonia-lyase [Pseudalkalibacillus caeni]TLS39386.1 threonine ammonia-lyase [Pseudalkalibacillus caeni]